MPVSSSHFIGGLSLLSGKLDVHFVAETLFAVEVLEGILGLFDRAEFDKSEIARLSRIEMD